MSNKGDVCMSFASEQCRIKVICVCHLRMNNVDEGGMCIYHLRVNKVE